MKKDILNYIPLLISLLLYSFLIVFFIINLNKYTIQTHDKSSCSNFL